MLHCVKKSIRSNLLVTIHLLLLTPVWMIFCILETSHLRNPLIQFFMSMEEIQQHDLRQQVSHDCNHCGPAKPGFWGPDFERFHAWECQCFGRTRTGRRQREREPERSGTRRIRQRQCQCFGPGTSVSRVEDEIGTKRQE